MSACGSDEPRSAAIETSAVIAAAATTPTIGAVPATAAPPELPATTTTNGPVFDFVTPASADGWRVTNDTVMGGVSSGELAWSDGALVFVGDLSLANGGGFASIRSPAIERA